MEEKGQTRQTNRPPQTSLKVLRTIICTVLYLTSSFFSASVLKFGLKLSNFFGAALGFGAWLTTRNKDWLSWRCRHISKQLSLGTQLLLSPLVFLVIQYWYAQQYSM